MGDDEEQNKKCQGGRANRTGRLARYEGRLWATFRDPDVGGWMWSFAERGDAREDAGLQENKLSVDLLSSVWLWNIREMSSYRPSGKGIWHL